MSDIGDIVALTAALAGLTTICLLIIGTPIAWWLAGQPSLMKDVAAVVVAMPVVLPPTVLGFYLLIAMAPASPLMALLHPFGIRTLNFSFAGLLIGSIVYSLPFAVQPIRAAFQSVGRRPLEIAATLGAGPWDRFASVAIPSARRGFVTAAVLVFAHTIGEFGVVLMIGGAIPQKTEVISIRIWRAVEQSDWAGAHALSAGLVLFSFTVLLLLLLAERTWAGRGRNAE